MHFCLEDFFIFSNSADIDEMPHYAAFNLGLHCLQKYIVPICRYQQWKVLLLSLILNFEK